MLAHHRSNSHFLISIDPLEIARNLKSYMVKLFVHSSVFSTTAEALTDFHNQPDVLRELTMPPILLQVLRDERTSLTQGEIEFRLWFGPLPVRWVARHAAGSIPSVFKDIQVRGPLAHWEHEHLIEAVSGGTRLTDRITFAHHAGVSGWLTRILFADLLLRLLFTYRHWRTRRALPAG